MIFSSVGYKPIYDSRKTHYGRVGNDAGKSLNIYETGTKIFDICPIIHYNDGGIEFLESFGGSATESPNYVIFLMPFQGVPVQYWKKITDEKVKQLLKW